VDEVLDLFLSLPLPSRKSWELNRLRLNHFVTTVLPKYSQHLCDGSH